jgi:methyl-accepting chemotaxis protein
MLNSLRISTKFLIMIGLSAIGILTVATLGLSTLKENALEDRRNGLKEKVLLARQMVEFDYQTSKKAGLSDVETLEHSKQLIHTLRFGKDDYFFAVDNGSVQVANPNPKVEGKNFYEAKDSDGVFFAREIVAASQRGGGFTSYRFPRVNSDQPSPKVAYSVPFAPYAWHIGGGIYIDDIDALFREQLIKIGALIGITLLLVIGMSLLLHRSIIKPLAAMTTAMQGLAGGNTTAEIPALGRRDEIGAMAQSLQVFRDGMIETRQLRSEQDAVKHQAEAERAGLLNSMANDFEGSVRASLDILTQSAGDMRATAQNMSTMAHEASQQTSTVASVAEQATVNVQTVAVATEELSASVSEIGRQVAHSTEIAGKAVAEADRTNATVQGLSEAAQKIGDVVGLINDIASQTNLLALNATIEAARAGDAGKGFAVVANEVKSLASQTAKATEEISAQVAAMQNATGEAVQAIGGIGGTIAAINQIATAIASAVEEQGAATREIARNVQQAAAGTGQVSSEIASVSRAAGAAGDSATSVRTAAEQLNEQASALRTGIDSFLANIRSA